MYYVLYDAYPLIMTVLFLCDIYDIWLNAHKIYRIDLLVHTILQYLTLSAKDSGKESIIISISFIIVIVIVIMWVL